MTICYRCWVSGRVQGVYYRGTTQLKAEALDVTGYARNLPDGRVEVMACGNKNQVEQLKSWLWEGPRLAQVEQVQCQQLEIDSIPTAFTTA